MSAKKSHSFQKGAKLKKEMRDNAGFFIIET